tara:strand:+ start:1889 stop:2176 length:288 start_codon:yes stop_codon:yes gene_type:complete
MPSEKAYTKPNNDLPVDEVIVYSHHFEEGQTVYVIPNHHMFQSRFKPNPKTVKKAIKNQPPKNNFNITLNITAVVETRCKRPIQCIVTTELTNFF